ncbi:hypothetical protein CNMCM5793_000490 [Aspergillus hiratsukae]|uniref:Uncharacterized protein n=1 Tax=Aspergillus hiratsukae TaxID=1194566 RepID=A0A8H6UG41_9EURO|nr:hypothetical protein CNMCM5793_000490 [Aspergillus hiratsukae]KAF7156941.1 hypothetical protein CNMCM6106_001720 [Aspergillus hiratsukae]
MQVLGSLFTVMCLLLGSSAALNITVLQPGVPLVPGRLPPSHAASDGEQIAELFKNLGRSTIWKLVEKVHFEGNTFEPEGIVRLGDDRYFVSAGEYIVPTVSYGNGTIINGTDRTAGEGFAHMMIFDGQGKRIADATLTERGAIEYHNGGIDYDGQYIWATIGQYRPNSTATVVRIDPYTVEPTTVLHANDHYGGIVHDTRTDDIVCLNWGSRNASTWNLRKKFAQPLAFTPPRSIVRNPSYYVDYQDCKFLGHPMAFDRRPVMLCSGVATLSNNLNLGGIAIVDLETMLPLAELPITLESDLGVPVTQNPVDVSVVGGQLRFYWLPDQHNSTLYVYEAQVDSPYEY